ncbi:hypothetical protein JCM12141A_53090 [Mycolicibacterium hodleri]
MTLNGLDTVTSGAAESVDPVTATLPVAPGNVHSGVPPAAGAADGHDSAAGDWPGAATADEVLLAAVDDEPGSASASEPHAASIMTSGAAHATNATERDARVEFTVATLQNGPSLISATA